MKTLSVVLSLVVSSALLGCPEEDAGTTDGATTADSTGEQIPAEVEDGGGDDHDATTGDDGAVAPTACEAYCAAVMASCQADNAQYSDETACVAFCEAAAQLPAGTSNDETGNSIACRLYHAEVASEPQDAGLHCPHAGPSGGGVCGTWCENYCHLALQNCTDEHALYEDPTDCLDHCAGLPDDGDANAKEGDSVQCRIYHLGVAGSALDLGSDSLHCPHGGFDGGGVCVEPAPTCAGYCAALSVACAGENAQFANEDACLAYCQDWAALAPGNAADTEGNTVGCRLYHAGVAAQSPQNAAAHCPHAGPAGGSVCGSWCDNYCDLAAANCTGEASLFDDAASCQEACAAFDADGEAGSTAGASVQCRIYHLGVAGSDPTGGSMEEHCAQGAPDGGGVCVSPPATCDSYCELLMVHCTGDEMQFSSIAECHPYCASGGQLPQGELGSASGNSLECRQYHAAAAGGGPDEAPLHCPHAGPSGGGVCGSWCENYCHLAALNCAGDDALFESPEACALACAPFSEAGEAGDVTGDTVQCRIQQLGAQHCENGAPDGGELCVDTPNCVDYCAAITAVCTDAAAQYDSQADCLVACADHYKLPKGSIEDVDVNTIGCRDYHLQLAVDSPDDAAIHCAHAGPHGGGQCGSWCDNYCALQQANCGFGPASEYATEGACLATCGGFVDSAVPGATAGDSVQCRIYHLGVAGSDAASAAVHCTHAALFSADGVCVDAEPSCEVYCKAIQNACGDDSDTSQYPDWATCLSYCGDFAALPPGTGDDVDDNTVGCRTYHARVATTLSATSLSGTTLSPMLHCAHAGPSGADVCGSWCDNYCHLAASNCAQEPNVLFADTDACTAACDALPASGQPGDTAGNTVQCRIYHLGVAGDAASGGPAVHCAHGGQDGAGICVGEVFLPGENCQHAIAIDVFPFSDARDTAHYNNDLSATCAPLAYGGASNDVVYSLTAGVTGTYTLTLAAEQDSVLYVLGACGDAGSCLGEVDELGNNKTEVLELAAVQGTTYFIVVDGWSNTTNEQGPYLFTVDEPCVAECAGKSCGDDGCGNACGPGCQSGELCLPAEGQCAAADTIPGNTCANPLAMAGLTVSGDTSVLTNVVTTQSSCPKGQGDAAKAPVDGDLTADAVFSFTASVDGLHTLDFATTGSGQPTTITVTTSCDDLATTCIGSSGDLFSNGDLQVSLAKGTTYFIVVDGNFANNQGPFELVVVEPKPLGAAPTWDGEVADIFAANCGNCHTVNSSGGHSIGNGDFAQATKLSIPPPEYCAGLSVGECSVLRVMNGTMPTNGTVSSQDKETLQAWLDAGMPEN